MISTGRTASPFPPTKSVLYIADSGRARGHGFGFDDTRPHNVRALEVIDGSKLGNSRVVAEIDMVPDGLRVDTEGLLWISAEDGVHCYTPDGKRLGRILVPEVVANLTFGGPEKSRLFISGDKLDLCTGDDEARCADPVRLARRQ